MGMVQWIQMTSPTFVHQTSLGQRWYKGFKCKILVIRLRYKESTPLKNMSSSVGILIPNIWKNKKCSKPPTTCKKDLNPFYPLGVAILDVPLEIFLRKSPTFPKPQAGRTRLLDAHPPQDVEFVAIGPTTCGIRQNIPGWGPIYNGLDSNGNGSMDSNDFSHIRAPKIIGSKMVKGIQL